jgi:type I restriction enzyme S subunit
MEKLQPILRFPEFEGDWDSKILGNIFNISSAARVHKNEWTESGVTFFRSSDVVSHFKGNTNTKAYISLKLYNTLSDKIGRVERDDILITGGGTIGIPFLVKNNDPLYFKDADLLWIKNKDQFNGYFLYTFFLTKSFQDYLNSISHVGTIAHYTINQVKNTPFTYPSLPEQQKIASFLSTVDEKINLLKKQLTLLEQYKKGVMQKIFSREIRFKDEDGREFPDWEEKKLGEVSQITTGASNRIDSNLYGEYTFFDRSQDIRSSNRFLFDTEAIIVPGEGQEFIPKYFVGKFDLHQRTYAIMNFQPNFGEFLYYFIGYNSNHLNSQAVGSTVKSLRLPMFEKMPIRLPSLPEQQKIASFLSAIDDKIDKNKEQILKMELWKKGLLQQMFI